VFTPSGLPVWSWASPRRVEPSDVLAESRPSSLSKEPVISVSVLVRTTGEWSEVVGYAKLAVS
jgi:hypothetical protein